VKPASTASITDASPERTRAGGIPRRSPMDDSTPPCTGALPRRLRIPPRTPGGTAGPEPRHGVVDDLGHRSVDVDDDARLIGTEGLERGELRIEQARRHEVTGASLGAGGEHVTASVEVHEPHLRRTREDGVAVVALQRGAGDDETGAPVGRLGERGADDLEPGPAVVVVERHTRRHLLDVGHRVQVVGVGERHAEVSREQGADRGLARARDAHHDDDGRLGSRRVGHQSCTVPSARRLYGR
jgi:hypothetical protein